MYVGEGEPLGPTPLGLSTENWLALLRVPVEVEEPYDDPLEELRKRAALLDGP